MIPRMTHMVDPEVVLPELDRWVFLYEILQQGNQRLILTLFLLVPAGAGTDVYSLTCLTMANLMLNDHVVNQAGGRRSKVWQQILLYDLPLILAPSNCY
jgi:hypothetical protein